jgi:hypothetical protein
MRPLRWTRSAARTLAAVLLAAVPAGCADFLTTPAETGARLSLSLQPAPPGAQMIPDSTFDAVDRLSVWVYRGDTVVMASFAVSPSGGSIRQVILVPLDADEEDVALGVVLYVRGQPVLAGEQALTLVRGQRTTVEMELIPVFPAPDLGVGLYPDHGAAGTRLPGEPSRSAP